MSGAQQRTSTGSLVSVPQWDLHMSARYERRHIFGTLGKLRLEEQPRLIFQQPFPETEAPRLGNILQARINQPGLLEARTDLSLSARWDYGPEPFLRFLRSDVTVRLAAERAFLDSALRAIVGLQHDRLFVQTSNVPTGVERPVNYRYSFVDQELQLDLRNDPIMPRRGVYIGVLASESVLLPPLSDFGMLRLESDLRGYLPLPLSMVLAARFAVAANFVLASGDIAGSSAKLGPYSYRLRGGGAQSNRGYLAGELGAGENGGLRRWESAVELRVRLGSAFGLVGFFDMGDVSPDRSFRFQLPHPSAGFGLRYLTLVGAIRFDVGFRLAEDSGNTLLLLGAPGAMHLTIGEAF